MSTTTSIADAEPHSGRAGEKTVVGLEDVESDERLRLTRSFTVATEYLHGSSLGRDEGLRVDLCEGEAG